MEVVLDAFYELGKRRAQQPLGDEGELSPPGPEALHDKADFCVFDTETTGLAARDVAVQVCVGFYDVRGRVLGFYNKLWKPPEGVPVSAGSVRVHGITERRLAQDGLDAACELPRLMRIFTRMRERKRRIVAHNAAFDVRILRQTAAAHGYRGWDLELGDTFCTMSAAAPRCGLVGKNGRVRRPKNAELYEILVGTAPSGALHDAQVDVSVTARSFVEGSARGWWAGPGMETKKDV